ncbi:DsbA family protein [Actinocatenispora rupis]|uniref:DSBA oxidoreductase n=1 Tax=Actinocatenispora rupis TaxID=519421 RepID=A0A8J3JEH1_9ACTN|nr:thioredoxin domain-containing protein [Actinocatenispora rupis]GID15219.1 DSBA oxidoreductase [Actinocatenispora rupis]
MSSRKNQRRAQQAVRAQLAAERRRRRMIWTSVLAAVVVLVAGGVTGAIVLTQRDARDSAAYAVPDTATRDDPGLRLGQGPVRVDVYFDYMCPNCKEFESLASSVLTSFVSTQKITLVYHPLDYLDSASAGTRYSTRSAAAAGCAADAGKLPDFTNALFGRQPKEKSSGLTNAQIVAAGKAAGITDASFATCVTSQKYRDWVSHVSNQASGKGVQSTPSVFVNDKQVDPSATALANAINAAA